MQRTFILLTFLSVCIIATSAYRFQTNNATTPQTGTEKNKAVTAVLFKEYRGVTADLPDFDFNAKCDILSYQIIITPRRNDPIVFNNQGWQFSREAKAVFSNLKAGDIISILDIKTICPGDMVTRNLGSMSYVLK